MGGPHRGRRGTKSRSASPSTVRHSHLWGLGNPTFFDHQLQTLMTLATVEDRTAGLGQTLCTGRALVGGLSFHGVLGLSLAQRLPGGFQVQGMRRRPMQAWVSCSGGRTTACDLHALGGAQRGEQRGPDLKHSETKGRSRAATMLPRVTVALLHHTGMHSRTSCSHRISVIDTFMPGQQLGIHRA